MKSFINDIITISVTQDDIKQALKGIGKKGEKLKEKKEAVLALDPELKDVPLDDLLKDYDDY